jgi:hypothetical protein
MAVQEIVIEQLLVGVLLLAPLIALLPTTFAFFTLMSVAQLLCAAAHCALLTTACAFDANPVFYLALWAVQPICGSPLLPGGMVLKFLGSSYNNGSYVATKATGSSGRGCANAERAQCHRSADVVHDVRCCEWRIAGRKAEMERLQVLHCRHQGPAGADSGGITVAHYDVQNCRCSLAQVLRPFGAEVLAAAWEAWLSDAGAWPSWSGRLVPLPDTSSRE